MYMKAPHKHKEWLAQKTARQQEYEALKLKKQMQQESKRKGSVADGKGSDEKKLKLKLADSVVEGLTTHMSISANDARKFVSSQLERFEANYKSESATDGKSLN